MFYIPQTLEGHFKIRGSNELMIRKFGNRNKSEISTKQPNKKSTKAEEQERDEMQLISLPLLKTAMPEIRHEPKTTESDP